MGSRGRIDVKRLSGPLPLKWIDPNPPVPLPAIGQTPAQESDKQRLAFRTYTDIQGRREGSDGSRKGGVVMVKILRLGKRIVCLSCSWVVFSSRDAEME